MRPPFFIVALAQSFISAFVGSVVCDLGRDLLIPGLFLFLGVS